ncbi:hypothetical protein [Glycomyces sp. NRRL B-16210]|uniref:hypothetical protein n=1 Tax=Glycomyces sp. NRRL B-16210 TaxID=1463821 RepID=UPI0004C18D74|nr:hypothetical protein [Glycomyces sp. NRRL B-16210]
MIPERYTTRRIRARYLRAMQAIPLPVRRSETAEAALPFDLAGLPILATETIDGRPVRFSLVVGQSRFRLTFKEIDPSLIGHVIALDSPSPRMVVSEPLHTEWALANERALTARAARAWEESTKHCER